MQTIKSYVIYRSYAGGGGGGATTFLELTDTPATYAGQALKTVRVNAGETALEFYTISGGYLETASNGLTVSGTDVQLGGSLTGFVNIAMNGFGIGFNGTGKVYFTLSATTAGINIGVGGADPSTFSNGDIWTRSGAFKIRLTSLTRNVLFTNAADITLDRFPYYNGVGEGQLTSSANFSTARIAPTPTATIPALNVGSFAGDPSAPINGDLNYNSTSNELRARINGAWVSLGASGISGSTNGLTDDGTTVKLGGVLTEDTSIDGDSGTYNLVFSGLASFDVSSPIIQLTSDGAIQLIGDDGVGNSVELAITSSGIVVQNSGTQTFEEFADYSANYTALSYITKGHADATYAPISGGAYWSLASGGTLTTPNTITGTTTNTLKFVFNGLGTTITDGAGHWLANTTAAAAGAQQWSPSMVWEGQGWKTNATAESQSVKVRNVLTPAQAAANPNVLFYWQYSINGGAYTTFMLYDQLSNQLTIPQTLFYNGSMVLRSGGTQSVTIGNGTSALAIGAVSFQNQNSYLNTSTAVNHISSSATFAPTSGTSTYTNIYSGGIVNQTGGANGQVTFINATPTITAAVYVTGYDWNPTNPNNISGTHLAFRATSGSMLIGGTTLTADAILDLQSTTKAFIPPRMTTGERDAIGTPSQGMLVYNTSTGKLNVYTTAWEAVTSV